MATRTITAWCRPGSMSAGLSLTFYWDNLQRLVGLMYLDSTSVSNVYSRLDLTATKDRMNYWTYYGYNAIRQKIAETNALGVVTAYDYCDCGALFSQTNAWNTPAQQVISFNYDYQGNLTYIWLPDTALTNSYNALGQVFSASDGWTIRTNLYNNQGLRTAVLSPGGTESSTVYDNEDRPLWVTDANGVTVTNSYDL